MCIDTFHLTSLHETINIAAGLTMFPLLLDTTVDSGFGSQEADTSAVDNDCETN